MDPEDFIKNLQHKPYATRLKILWSTVTVIAVVLLLVWGFSIKSTIKGLDAKSLINLPNQTTSNSVESTNNWMSVERVESSSTALKIFFNVNNPTDDILNFPKTDSITLLVANGQTTNPSVVTDRQGGDFVQKVLSNTQNFGIMVFPASNASAGTLTIDDLTLEKNPDQIFKQELNLNFKDLEQSTNIRN